MIEYFSGQGPTPSSFFSFLQQEINNSTNTTTQQHHYGPEINTSLSVARVTVVTVLSSLSLLFSLIFLVATCALRVKRLQPIKTRSITPWISTLAHSIRAISTLVFITQPSLVPIEYYVFIFGVYPACITLFTSYLFQYLRYILLQLLQRRQSSFQSQLARKSLAPDENTVGGNPQQLRLQRNIRILKVSTGGATTALVCMVFLAVWYIISFIVFFSYHSKLEYISSSAPSFPTIVADNYSTDTIIYVAALAFFSVGFVALLLVDFCFTSTTCTATDRNTLKLKMEMDTMHFRRESLLLCFFSFLFTLVYTIVFSLKRTARKGQVDYGYMVAAEIIENLLYLALVLVQPGYIVVVTILNIQSQKKARMNLQKLLSSNFWESKSSQSEFEAELANFRRLSIRYSKAMNISNGADTHAVVTIAPLSSNTELSSSGALDSSHIGTSHTDTVSSSIPTIQGVAETPSSFAEKMGGSAPEETAPYAPSSVQQTPPTIPSLPASPVPSSSGHSSSFTSLLRSNNAATPAKPLMPQADSPNNGSFRPTGSNNKRAKDIVRQTLLNHETYTLFKEYAEKEFSVENVLFWSAINQYLKMFEKPTNKKQKVPTMKDKLQQAQNIYTTYIDPKASLEINVSIKLKNDVKQKLMRIALLTNATIVPSSKSKFDEAVDLDIDILGKSLFDPCLRAVETNLTDTFSRFCCTSKYKEYLNSKLQIG